MRQLTLLYNLLDSLLHFTICGTACSSIQFVGQLALAYNLWDRPGHPVLQNNICYTYPLLARFHFMFYQYCKHICNTLYIIILFIILLLYIMYAIHIVIQCSHSSKQCVLSSKCFICSAPLKKQLRCLTQMRFAVKLSSLIVSKSAQL